MNSNGTLSVRGISEQRQSSMKEYLWISFNWEDVSHRC